MITSFIIIIFAILVIFLFIAFAYINDKIDKLQMKISKLNNKEENDFLEITLSIAKLDSRTNELKKEIEKHKNKEDL